MNNKKQFLAAIIAVLISVGLVATAVYATTIGNDVDVGGDLTVTATTTLEGDVVIGNAAGDTITITGTPTFGATTTFSDVIILSPTLTGATTSVLTMGTSAAELDFSNMTGSNTGQSIYITASAADAQIKGLEVNVTDTGSTGANYLRALQLRLTKEGGAANLDGAESYMWGINNEVAMTGGEMLNVWGDVSGVSVTGTSTVGAAGGSPNQIAALYAKTYIATSTTIADVLDAAIIASIIDGASERKKATAAVLAVLRGGGLGDSSATSTAGAAFKVMDMISEADNSGSNFDYGLDLYNVDNTAGRGYANVFAEADIRLSNGALIANGDANTLTITEGNVVLTTARTITASEEKHGLDVNFTGTMGASSGAVAGNFIMTTAGTGGAWASGIYAKVVQDATKHVTGYLSAAEFEVINTNTNVSDWFPLVLNANSTTNGQHSSYIALRDYGSTKIQSFLWIEDQTIGSNSPTALVSSYTSASSSASHSIRVIIDDTPYWILLSNTAPN